MFRLAGRILRLLLLAELCGDQPVMPEKKENSGNETGGKDDQRSHELVSCNLGPGSQQYRFFAAHGLSDCNGLRREVDTFPRHLGLVGISRLATSFQRNGSLKQTNPVADYDFQAVA